MKGQEVLLLLRDTDVPKSVFMKRTVDLSRDRLLCSPMDEHHKEGVAPSNRPSFPWKFNVKGLWAVGDNADNVVELYAANVHVVDVNTNKSANTVLIQGSKSNVYTVVLNDLGVPESCTCPVYRFRRKTCKHMYAAERGATYA